MKKTENKTLVAQDKRIYSKFHRSASRVGLGVLHRSSHPGTLHAVGTVTIVQGGFPAPHPRDATHVQKLTAGSLKLDTQPSRRVAHGGEEHQMPLLQTDQRSQTHCPSEARKVNGDV